MLAEAVLLSGVLFCAHFLWTWLKTRRSPLPPGMTQVLRHQSYRLILSCMKYL